jgi:hypothetical protein
MTTASPEILMQGVAAVGSGALLGVTVISPKMSANNTTLIASQRLFAAL